MGAFQWRACCSGPKTGHNVLVRVRYANANPNEGRAGPGCAVGDSPPRSRGARGSGITGVRCPAAKVAQVLRKQVRKVEGAGLRVRAGWAARERARGGKGAGPGGEKKMTGPAGEKGLERVGPKRGEGGSGPGC